MPLRTVAADRPISDVTEIPAFVAHAVEQARLTFERTLPLIERELEFSENFGAMERLLRGGFRLA
ncbi:MAG: hypothetical protein AB7N24_17355 [Dehalococcoidia bacterium]